MSSQNNNNPNTIIPNPSITNFKFNNKSFKFSNFRIKSLGYSCIVVAMITIIFIQIFGRQHIGNPFDDDKFIFKNITPPLSLIDNRTVELRLVTMIGFNFSAWCFFIMSECVKQRIEVIIGCVLLSLSSFDIKEDKDKKESANGNDTQNKQQLQTSDTSGAPNSPSNQMNQNQEVSDMIIPASDSAILAQIDIKNNFNSPSRLENTVTSDSSPNSKSQSPTSPKSFELVQIHGSQIQKAHQKQVFVGDPPESAWRQLKTELERDPPSPVQSLGLSSNQSQMVNNGQQSKSDNDYIQNDISMIALSIDESNFDAVADGNAVTKNRKSLSSDSKKLTQRDILFCLSVPYDPCYSCFKRLRKRVNGQGQKDSDDSTNKSDSNPGPNTLLLALIQHCENRESEQIKPSAKSYTDSANKIIQNIRQRFFNPHPNSNISLYKNRDYIKPQSITPHDQTLILSSYHQLFLKRLILRRLTVMRRASLIGSLGLSFLCTFPFPHPPMKKRLFGYLLSSESKFQQYMHEIGVILLFGGVGVYMYWYVRLNREIGYYRRQCKGAKVEGEVQVESVGSNTAVGTESVSENSKESKLRVIESASSIRWHKSNINSFCYWLESVRPDLNIKDIKCGRNTNVNKSDSHHQNWHSLRYSIFLLLIIIGIWMFLVGSVLNLQLRSGNAWHDCVGIGQYGAIFCILAWIFVAARSIDNDELLSCWKIENSGVISSSGVSEKTIQLFEPEAAKLGSDSDSVNNKIVNQDPDPVNLSLNNILIDVTGPQTQAEDPNQNLNDNNPDPVSFTFHSPYDSEAGNMSRPTDSHNNSSKTITVTTVQSKDSKESLRESIGINSNTRTLEVDVDESHVKFDDDDDEISSANSKEL